MARSKAASRPPMLKIRLLVAPLSTLLVFAASSVGLADGGDATHPASSPAQARPPAGHPASDWVFDVAPYTHDPKSGERVWQYSEGVTPRHDPNAIFDSPHSPYPFAPDLYDPLWNYGQPMQYAPPGLHGPYVPGSTTPYYPLETHENR